MLKQNCPDECPVCAGRDYVSPGVLEEAARNGFDFHSLPPSCPRYLEAQLEAVREKAQTIVNHKKKNVPDALTDNWVAGYVGAGGDILYVLKSNDKT